MRRRGRRAAARAPARSRPVSQAAVRARSCCMQARMATLGHSNSRSTSRTRCAPNLRGYSAAITCGRQTNCERSDGRGRPRWNARRQRPQDFRCRPCRDRTGGRCRHPRRAGDGPSVRRVEAVRGGARITRTVRSSARRGHLRHRHRRAAARHAASLGRRVGRIRCIAAQGYHLSSISAIRCISTIRAPRPTNTFGWPASSRSRCRICARCSPARRRQAP